MEHTYTVGQNPEDRATLIIEQILNRVHDGHGVFFLDPHGHITDRLLPLLPYKRRHDVILFDLSDQEWPISFNPLQADAHISTITSAIENAIKDSAKMGDGSTGVMSMHIRACVYPLIKAGEPLLGMYPMLLSDSYRERVLKDIDDELISQHWAAFEPLNRRERRQEISSTYNKAFALLLDTRIRNVLGQPKSAFDMSDVLNGKIFLARLPLGKLGKEQVKSFGQLLLAQLKLSIYTRTSKEPFYVHILDSQLLHGVTLNELLYTALLYDTAITLSEPSPSVEILSYIPTKHVFRVSMKDADAINENLGSDNVRLDLYSIEPHHYRTFDGFVGYRNDSSLLDLPNRKYDGEMPRLVKELSRRQYARPEAVVHAETNRLITKT